MRQHKQAPKAPRWKPSWRDVLLYTSVVNVSLLQPTLINLSSLNTNNRDATARRRSLFVPSPGLNIYQSIWAVSWPTVKLLFKVCPLVSLPQVDVFQLRDHTLPLLQSPIWLSHPQMREWMNTLTPSRLVYQGWGRGAQTNSRTPSPWVLPICAFWLCPAVASGWKEFL